MPRILINYLCDGVNPLMNPLRINVRSVPLLARVEEMTLRMGMQKIISRRTMVEGGVMAGSIVPLLALSTISARAAGLPPLDANDPTAKALGFVVDTNKVDSSANPTHKATQKCASCAQFQGNASDASGGCNIFAGHSVPQGGWCKVWAQKP